MALVYKICSVSLWNEAARSGIFPGAPVDIADGYIHFSTAEQVRETASRHFAGQDDLVLVAVEDSALGPDLRYEASRGGALFPHLYGPWRIETAAWVLPLPIGPDGTHRFPPEVP